MKKYHYSCTELAKLHLAGFPTSRQGWDAIVKREKWEYVEVKSPGIKGKTREYMPPERVRLLIESMDLKSYKPAHPIKPIHTGENEHTGHIANERQPHAAPDGFVLVPRYDVAASMGHGAIIHSEQVVDHLAFRSEWVRTELGTSPNNLVLISAIGDSMEPTLRAGDLLLIDRSVESVKQDAVYAIAQDGELRIKRIQRLFDGSLIIKSDNPSYQPENLTSDQAGRMRIVGRVVWSGRRM